MLRAMAQAAGTNTGRADVRPDTFLRFLFVKPFTFKMIFFNFTNAFNVTIEKRRESSNKI